MEVSLFEGNAIGQIGEKFVKSIFDIYQISYTTDTKEIIHDEYDILSNGKKIEVKTARKGLKNDSFQFNGINPNYNYSFIILIGITSSNVLYHIVPKPYYVHKDRKHIIDISINNQKSLVAMNPGGNVNYKLTLNLKDLKPIDDIANELKSLLMN